MIDGGEIFADIAFQDVRVSGGGLAGALHGEMSAETFAAGEGIREETGLPNGFEDTGECVVDDAIPERRGGDPARFGVANLEGAIGAGAVNAGVELFAEGDEVGFEGEEEGGDVRSGAFAGGGGEGGAEQVTESSEGRPEVADSFHSGSRGVRRDCLRQPPTMRPMFSQFSAAKA